MFKSIKKLIHIYKSYDKDIKYLNNTIIGLQRDICRLEKLLLERTELAADVSMSSTDFSTIIMLGRFRNNDYVKVQQLRHSDFAELVNHMRSLSRHAKPTYLDTGYDKNLEFLIKREVK